MALEIISLALFGGLVALWLFLPGGESVTPEHREQETAPRPAPRRAA